jgi:hypothetical protein
MKNFIYIPDGYEVDKERSTFEVIYLKPITPTLPKKWEDLKKVTGWYADEVSQASRCGDMPAHSNNYNVFVTKAQADASIALAQLSQLREVYRQGWKPNWCENIYKHFIYYYEGEISIACNHYHSHFLSFQSKEVAEEFLKNFKDLIEIAKPLIS